MGFEDIKSMLDTNVSMDTKKKTIAVNSVMRSYRIDADIVLAMDEADINKNKAVNKALRSYLSERGLL